MRLRLLLLTIAFLSAACSQNNCGERQPTTELFIGQQRLLVEVADTMEVMQCGLAFRDELPSGEGMLFVFDDERPRVFWMKDTRIPLSIAFLDASKRIIKIDDMDVPLSTQQLHSSVPAKYALETNIGWFERAGIQGGDVVRFDLPDKPRTSVNAND